MKASSIVCYRVLSRGRLCRLRRPPPSAPPGEAARVPGVAVCVAPPGPNIWATPAARLALMIGASCGGAPLVWRHHRHEERSALGVSL